MSDAETHTVDTIYGEAEIEVVECSSCETEIAKAEAEPFTIGEGSDKREGWACDHCAEEGPAGFPMQGALDVDLAPVFVAGWPFFFALGVGDILSGRLTEEGRMYLLGGVGAALWVGFLVTVVVLGEPTTASEGVPPL